MSSIRVSGNTSGYYDLTVPDVAGTNTIPLNQVVTTDANGNLGVGTATPVTSLHVAKAGNGIVTIERTNKASGTGYFGINVENNSQTTLAFDNTSNFVIGRSSDPSSQAGFNNDFLINSSGNVGIGVVSPVSKLHVARNNNNTDQASKAGAFTLRTQEDDGMEWHLSHSTNGYVGWAASAKINNYGGNWGDAYLEFATAGASGGNGQAALRMHQGITTQPNVPAFDAYYTTNGTWSIGASNTLVFNATTFNQGGHYNTSNGRFTAPVSGVYHFSFYSIYYGNYGNGDLNLYVNGVRGNGTDRHFSSNEGNLWNTVSGSNTRYLNAGDYVMVFSRSGADFHGGYWSNFSGHLVG